jgi:hypothetical protein
LALSDDRRRRRQHGIHRSGGGVIRQNAAWTPLGYTPTERAKYGDATLNSDRGGLG